VIGRNPRLLSSGRHDAAFFREMWETIRRVGGWQGEIWDRRKNGEIYPKWLTITAVKADDGRVTHYIGTHYDITERKLAEEQIKELAFFDALTHLPNRTLLRDRLKQVMKARRYRPLFIVDIAVPRDVEADAGKLDGVYLFDIDDLENVVAQNRKGRDDEASSAERIVEAETAQFLAWMRAQGVVPTIKELRERFLSVALAEAERTLAALGGRLDDAGQASVRQMAEAIVAKLLHTPLMALKSNEEVDLLVAATRRLFALEGKKER